MRPYRFHPEALAEYEAAALWYADRSTVAAIAFTAAVDPDLRRRVLRNVPYSIIYALDGDAVVVLAVAHHKRRPGYWLRRLAR